MIGRARRFLTLVLPTLWLGLGLAACDNAPPPVDKVEIRPQAPTPTEDEAAILTNAPKVTCAIRLIAVPLDRPLDEAWSQVDETVLNELSRAVWNGNGLRLGVLNRANESDFADALGNLTFQKDSMYVGYDQLTDIRRSKPLRAEFFVDLTRPPAPMHIEHFTGGELCLLTAMRPAGIDAAYIELIPQHYKAKASLVPRTPMEKLLDGTIYRDLGVSLALAPSEALVIGLYRPAARVDTEQAPEDSAVFEMPDPQEQAELPLNLGRGLFTAGRTQDDLQFMMLLRVLPSQ